ncbi:MAG: electron transport complex subunit RsxC [Candidatus Omnitrophica bacterium]|nr:electron transport complex subunit RsxC [Candidatus Omnitrophota bacterium]
MFRLEEHKEETENKAIAKTVLPSRAYIPLSQHLGRICNPEVKIGDSVSTGQRIAAADARIYAPIHASLSGKVTSISDWPHPLLGRCKSIIIQGDGQDKSQIPNPKSQTDIENLTPEQIRNIVFEAGIVGMGGAAFPTHIKLSPPSPVDTLIVNGTECEPYLTADYRLMLEKTKEILQGIELVVKCLGVKKVYIAIEDNKPQAIEKFKIQNSPPKAGPPSAEKFKIKVLKSQYPQGGEKQLTKNILGREVPQGKLPFDIGVVVHNVATVFAIYEAVYLGKPLYERVVTVTGDCLENPGNFLVRIGTPLSDLITQCGPLKKKPEKIIFGGPMMGFAQYSLDTPVIKNTNGVILFSDTEIKVAEEAACIRCSRCVEHCPLGLMPCLISLACQKERWDAARSYGCLDCMECGLCDYVCPQRRNIVQAIKRAKALLNR